MVETLLGLSKDLHNADDATSRWGDRIARGATEAGNAVALAQCMVA